MIRYYTRWGRGVLVVVPWWAIAVFALLYVLGLAVVCALMLVWIVVRLPLIGLDKLTGNRVSHAVRLVIWQAKQPVSFDEARHQALARHGKRGRHA